MFQQSRLMHSMEPMEFLSHRMSPHGGAIQNLDLSAAGQASANKRQRVDNSGAGAPAHSSTGQATPGATVATAAGLGYDPHAVNFFSMDTPSLVVSKAEYEVVKQEVISVKRALGELRNNINSELDQLKTENRVLKSQVASCSNCRQRRTPIRMRVDNNRNHNQSSEKSSEDDGDLQTSFDGDKNLDEDSVQMRAYVEILERENKASLLRVHELEKQLHQVRAASNRVPPIPSGQAMSFFRELMAYYTLIESTVEAASAHAANDGTGGGGVTSLDGRSQAGGTDGSTVYDSALFPNHVPSTCSMYGLGLMQPEAFDVEKGLQVQLLPNYNVWVSKSKLQFILKEASSLKEGAPLFVLRRLIPLVFTWDELAASRGQGLNCKSTDDVLNKDPLDPTKVLVSKAYMRKFCLETGQPEPPEKSINETFSHQVNYARRKFKRTSTGSSVVTQQVVNAQGVVVTLAENDGHHHHHQHDNDDAFSQSQCHESG